MPQLVRRNFRRSSPSRFPFSSASSIVRRSTRFWISLWGGGRYSPFDTICVGIGVSADAVSAPATKRCSRSLSQLAMAFHSLVVGLDSLLFTSIFRLFFCTPSISLAMIQDNCRVQTQGSPNLGVISRRVVAEIRQAQ